MRFTDAAPRRGFILPTTLLVMVLLTVMLTAAFILASAEFRATDNSLASNRALSLAQAGLENYFSQQRNLDTGSTYDSLRISFSNGYADVVGTRLRAQVASHFPLWLVRSIGTSTDPKQPGQPQGQRAVAELAELNNGIIPARAAITAINGIQLVAGASNTNPLSGHDGNYGASVPNCTKPGGALNDTAAYSAGGLLPVIGIAGNIAVVGPNLYVHSGGGGNFISRNFYVGEVIVAGGFTNAANNGLAVITSFPNNQTAAVSRSLVAEGSAANRSISAAPGNYLPGSAGNPVGTQEVFSPSADYDSSHIDWQNLLAGNYTPDYTGSLPAAGNSTYYSYYWTGDVTVPTGQRRGLLVATGDVRLSSGTHWDGIIIAGGRLIANGTPATFTYTVHGMVITGLNCGTGSCPATQDSLQTGQAASAGIIWDWCYTHAAIGGLNGLKPLKNTWVDTWSLY